MSNSEDPRVVRSRSQVIDAARRVFLASGYHATTLQQVADEAGIAKRTIYNLYGDKDTLFRATVLSAIDIADSFARSLATEVRRVEDAAAQLPEIGVRLAESTLLGPAVPLRRLVIMESASFPELVTEYRTRAPEAVIEALAELFATMAAAGTLVVADKDIAAEHFAFLVMGADLDRGTFTGDHPTAPRVRARARAGVSVFLRAYAPVGRSNA
jgi:TetR/AcrR family transcriptional repressor of mexJK operon